MITRKEYIKKLKGRLIERDELIRSLRTHLKFINKKIEYMLKHAYSKGK